LLVDPVPPVPVLADPVPPVPVLADPVLVDPVPTVPLPSVPVLVDPAAGPSEAVSVGLVLALPEPGELDAGEAGVEEPLPGVDEEAVTWGLAFLGGGALLGGQEGVAVALADALPSPLVLAFAEAFEVAVLTAVAVAVAGAFAVVVSPGLVLPPPGPSLVPLSVALPDGLLTELAGVSLGVAEVAGLAAFVDLAGADDAEPDGHAIAGALPCAAEVPLPAPPAAEPIGVPSPFVL
jgi:hypothetical protein